MKLALLVLALVICNAPNAIQDSTLRLPPSVLPALRCVSRVQANITVSLANIIELESNVTASMSMDLTTLNKHRGAELVK